MCKQRFCSFRNQDNIMEWLICVPVDVDPLPFPSRGIMVIYLDYVKVVKVFNP